MASTSFLIVTKIRNFINEHYLHLTLPFVAFRCHPVFVTFTNILKSKGVKTFLVLGGRYCH